MAAAVDEHAILRSVVGSEGGDDTGDMVEDSILGIFRVLWDPLHLVTQLGAIRGHTEDAPGGVCQLQKRRQCLGRESTVECDDGRFDKVEHPETQKNFAKADVGHDFVNFVKYDEIKAAFVLQILEIS